jgi:hypothetical protein
MPPKGSKGSNKKKTPPAKKTTVSVAPRPQPRKKRRTTTDLQGTTVTQASYLQPNRLASEEVSPLSSDNEESSPAETSQSLSRSVIIEGPMRMRQGSSTH